MTQFWYLLVLAEILRWENSSAESFDCQVGVTRGPGWNLTEQPLGKDWKDKKYRGVCSYILSCI